MSDILELLSRHTREALGRQTTDYISKDTDEDEFIAGLRRRYGLERVYRFDIGKHTGGYSDLIEGVLERADLAGLCRANLVEYPDNHYNLLCASLGRRLGVDPSWFVVSCGLEAVIDHISRALLQDGDCCLVPVPNFAVFADFSQRAGARVLEQALLPADRFQWTPQTVTSLAESMARRRPRLIWISNPVNPTGQHLPLEWIAELLRAGRDNGCAVVVDEAYGEYTDRDGGPVSAASLLADSPHLMVLRTFSKIHALPSLRVGYMMCASPEIRRAVSLYRPMFPFSWFSLFVAQIASVDEEHVQQARAGNGPRRERLRAQLASIGGFQCLDSRTNTLMLRHAGMDSAALFQELARRGMLTAELGRLPGLVGQGFVRLTVRGDAENDQFAEACRDIADCRAAEGCD